MLSHFSEDSMATLYTLINAIFNDSQLMKWKHGGWLISLDLRNPETASQIVFCHLDSRWLNVIVYSTQIISAAEKHGCITIVLRVWIMCCLTDLICNIIHYDDTMSTSVVAGRDCTKPFLPRCIPLWKDKDYPVDSWLCMNTDKENTQNNNTIISTLKNSLDNNF